MIYQPRNVSPSGNSIDASKTNTFSMEIQTNTFVSYYQLIISDFDNNDIYTGNKTALDNYVYNGEYLSFEVANNIMTNGEDYKWRVKLYQQNADMQITYGIVQAEGSSTEIHISQNINIKSGMTISINGETKNITNYDLDTSVVTVESAFSFAPQIGDKYTINSDFIETVPDFIVYARKDPEVSINNIPEELTLKYHIFNGIYTQDNNVPIVYHQFNLYLKNSDNTFTLIDSSDKVYSANLTYSYDAFRTGNTYAIEMIVENDMGTIAKTELYEFNVNYEIIEYLQQPTAKLDLNKNAISVSWETPVENEAVSNSSGAASGTIQDGANSLTQAVFEDNQTLGNGDQVQIIANSVGKNLINIVANNVNINGAICNMQNNQLKITGQPTASSTIALLGNPVYRAGTYFQSLALDTNNSILLSAGTYTLNMQTTGQPIIAVYGNLGDSYNSGGTVLTDKETFILEEDKYLALFVYISSTVEYDFYLYNVQLEKGDVLSSYEPYRAIGTKYTGVINSYNAITGVGTTLNDYPFTYTPMPGDTYQVLSNIYNNTGFQYLYNTPYNTVNSLYTHGYTATWSTPDGLCIMPDDFNITLQFSPDSNFFYDSEGNYIEDVTFIEGTTDDTSGNGNFKLSIDKNKFIFTMQPDISLEQFFYNNTNMVFVLNQNSIPQINNDYVWDDDSNWNDDYYWVEGGTSLERVCNHWWKIQITKTGIKIEEIYPSS